MKAGELLNLSSTDAQIPASDYAKWQGNYADLSASTETDFRSTERSLSKRHLADLSADDFKQRHNTNRDRYAQHKEALKEMKEGLDKLITHIVSHQDDNGDCENMFFKEDLILSMHNPEVVQRIREYEEEGGMRGRAPFSFDPVMWRHDIERQEVVCLMNWACLRRVQWVKLKPHLVSYLFDKSYTP